MSFPLQTWFLAMTIEKLANNAVEFYQCIVSNDEAFIKYQDCGSFYEHGNYCPLLYVNTEE